MLYGQELIDSLHSTIERHNASRLDRAKRIAAWETDEDDCFLSERVNVNGISLAEEKLRILKQGGVEWFLEYATISGELVSSRWCATRYGYKLRAEMPDGSVVWTAADTAKGLAKVGLKKVRCLRPAWACLKGSCSGLMSAYTATPHVFPSDTNYMTGEPASSDPIEIEEI